MNPSATALSEVTVVMVTFNSAHILHSSLPALISLKNVIIVDNASTDKTLDVVAELLPHARIIRNTENIGFGRANNVGLDQVESPYALLLNPDCSINPDSICVLLEAAQRYPEAAIFAPKIETDIGPPSDNFRPAYHVKLKPAKHLIMSGGDLCANWLIGAAMFMNMRHMRSVGFFDPWFFLFYEEEDLCMRVRRAGFPIMVIPAAVAKHNSGQSSKSAAPQSFRRIYYLTLSRLYITRKHFGRIALVQKFTSVLIGSLLGVPFYLLLFNGRLFKRSLARLKAAIRAPLELLSPHCQPPSD